MTPHLNYYASVVIVVTFLYDVVRIERNTFCWYLACALKWRFMWTWALMTPSIQALSSAETPKTDVYSSMHNMKSGHQLVPQGR